MDPILLNIPYQLTTDRLILRVPRPGDGERINAAVRASAEELALWMPWAAPTPDVENSETWARRAAARFLTREELHYSLCLKGSDVCVGACGMHHLNWKIPMVEIGYWLRTADCGKGLMTEAVGALTAMAFNVVKAARVQIRCDEKNARSRQVAERSGFQLDGILRNDSRDLREGLRNTCVFSKVV